tara:strand:+ start:842 stop:2962 length:2121 start_codon:yes stop_codon:yes gene_type:complete
MKNHIFLVITLFLSYSITFGQIPDPQYNNYNYLDSTKNNQSYNHQKKFQPKILFGMGEFNFKGDIEDTRNNGLIGRTGVHFGLSTNINDYFNLSIILQEGIVRVDGIKEESVPTNYPENFMSTLNSIGLYLDYNFKNFVFRKLVISPFLTTGINYLRFDSKGSNDETNDEYEINLAELWTLDPENEDKYSENTFGIPLGFGVNLKLSERMDFKFSSIMHITGTDYIDNIVNGGNDRYVVTSGTFIYDIFCYECDEEIVPIYNDADFADVNYEILDKEDSDKDGIIDINDFCSNTIKGVKVDEFGCPIDSDNDGVADYKDIEENTPQGSIVNTQGVQLTDEMGEKLYLSYLNSGSRSDASVYFEEKYPTEKFVKITKEVINKKGDTLSIDIYKPRIVLLIEEQEKKNIGGVIPATQVDLTSNPTYRVRIDMYDKGISAEKINNLLSISDLKSTLIQKTSVYFSGEFENMLEAREYNKQMVLKGYDKSVVMEDLRGELRIIDEEELDREEAKSTAVLKENLPKIENILFRVFLESKIADEYDRDFYDLDDIQPLPGEDGFTYIYSGSFSNYEDAIQHRNNRYELGYDNAKVIAFKDGNIVNSEEYMKTYEKQKESAVYGDVTFEIQLGYASNINEIKEIDLINSLDNVKIRKNDEGLVRYSVGNYKNLQSASIKHTEIQKLGFENAYIIAFYNDVQISLKKAQELIGF